MQNVEYTLNSTKINYDAFVIQFCNLPCDVETENFLVKIRFVRSDSILNIVIRGMNAQFNLNEKRWSRDST